MSGGTAPNPHDRALVIGIRRYGDVAAGWITNLEGPDNDAAAVAEWLRDPAGGGLRSENVVVVRSADAPDPFSADGPEPHQKAVISALDSFANLPKNAHGQFAGRRLYLYVSGHGWAQRRDEIAVITADASRQSPVNVLVSSWLDWMYEAGYFEELVLWADTCATRELAFLQGCVLPPRRSLNSASVRMFAGFAAPLGLRAVENEMPDGKWHGVFTYALLQGLRGAAGTPVTSDTLRDYLRNAMRDFQRPEQQRMKLVAREPAFGRSDPIEFATPARLRFPITLRLPEAAIGKRAFVAKSRSDPRVAEAVLAGRDWPVELEAGAYGVYVDELGLAEALLVSGGLDGAITIG